MSLPFNKNADPVPVYFARLPETPQNNPYEPQRVRVLENSTAVLHIDNRNREVGGNPFNFRVKFSQTPQNIKRISLVATQFMPLAPNVNNKCNTLTVVVPAGPDAGTYNFTLVNGYYITGASIATMINGVLAAGPIPAMNISWSAVSQRFTLAFTSPFYIEPTCTFIRYGQSMFGFPASVVPLASITGEYATLRFNKTIIIRSESLTQYEKNNSTSSNPRISDPLFILYTNTVPTETGQRLLTAFTPFPEFRNFEPATQITGADFEILDEWGDSPITYTDSPTSWVIQITVYTQV